jgi:hypothetical protein
LVAVTAVQNLALEAFIEHLPEERVFAQVLIRREREVFELRHVDDRNRAAGELKLLNLAELHELAQFSATGAFRSLKSSPNLQQGWRVVVSTAPDFEAALSRIYPGGIADWYAARSAPQPPVTNYRDFTGRQTGMYRITTMLSDAQAADVIRAGCHRRFCLKQRLWTVAGLEPDKAEEKSLLPCLEPCPVLLEFARKGMRIEQEEKIPMQFASSDLEAAVKAFEHPALHLREADFDSPENPRRQQLALEKLKRLLETRTKTRASTSPSDD